MSGSFLKNLPTLGLALLISFLLGVLFAPQNADAAISYNVLEEGDGSSTGVNVVTGSVSPAAGKLYLAHIGARFDSAPPDSDVWTLTGLGLTWEKVHEMRFETNRSMAVFRATGTPTPGTLTFTEDSGTTGIATGGASWTIMEVSGTELGNNGADAIEEINTDGNNIEGGNPPVNLTITGTPDAGDATIAFIGTLDNTNTVSTADANWTGIASSFGAEVQVHTYFSAVADQSLQIDWINSPSDRPLFTVGFILNAVAEEEAPARTLILNAELIRIVSGKVVILANGGGGGAGPVYESEDPVPPAQGDMAAWYRGDSLVGSGTATGWEDKTSNNLDLDAVNSPVIATNVLNGKTVARFEMNDADYFESATVAVAEAPATLVIIGYCTGDNDDGHIMDSGFGGTGNVINCGGDFDPYVNFWAEGEGIASNLFSTDAWHLLQVNSPDSTGTIYVDGLSVATGNSGAVNLESGVRIGYARVNDPQYAFDGDIAEVIIYDKVLSSGEKSALETYVAEYYGLDVGDDPSGDGIVDRIGSIGTELGSAANSDSEDISVPEDAELMVLVANGWPNEIASYYSGGTVTLGGNALTLGVDGDGDGSVQEGSLYYIDVRSLEGTRTLAWNWAGAGTGGCIANLTYAFYKDVDMTSPITDTGGEIDSDPFTTGSMTAASGDMIVAGLAATDNTSVNWTNATSQSISDFSCGRLHYAEGAPSGNTTVTADITAGDTDGSLMSVVLNAAP